MKKRVHLFFYLLVFTLSVSAQVKTINYHENEAFSLHPKLNPTNRDISSQTMESFDAFKLLEEDKKNVGLAVPYRFGYGFDVNYTLKDGIWSDGVDERVWSFKVSSKGAYSLNFVFEDLYLAEGSELYIFSVDGSTVYGPVINAQSTKGIFLTDLVKGDIAIIQLFEPHIVKKPSNFTIKRIVHGYRGLPLNGKGLGDSENCNVDVNCHQEWANESDAVALVLLSSGAEWCSGSLLTSTAQDFRPLFLTAFHCIDSNFNGILSDSEIANAENWMFRFQFKMQICGGNKETTSITYNGANFRTAWWNTDFALMELVSSLLGDGRFTWLGWNISEEVPTSGTAIHHPSGDAMKISTESNQFQISSWGANNNHWLVNFDEGVVEHGQYWAAIDYYPVQFDRGESYGYRNTLPNLNAKLEITKLDTVENIISGVFEFEASQDFPEINPEKILYVTEGRFDFRYNQDGSVVEGYSN